MNNSLYKGWKSIQIQLTRYFYNPQNCLTAIHQLWNPPPQCSFLQLCLLLHSGTQELKNSSGHQARWHSKWCSWPEQGREIAVLFSSVFSWLTPLTGICRGTTANTLESESELMGRKRQTWDTAGNLTDMLNQSITRILEIKFKISLKRKKSSVKIHLNVLA